MPEQEEGRFIPHTENLQRVARREQCACGDVIELPFDASTKVIEEAVRRHQKTARHRAWWQYVETSE